MSLLPELIVTPRLRLRAPVITDAEAIFSAYAQDPEVCRYMVWAPHRTVETTRAFVSACIDAWNAGDRRAYIICGTGSDEPIGMLEARPLGSLVDIGYVLARAHWGGGLMPEAIGAFTRTALSLPGLFRVQATCDVDNRPSRRALEKSGFRLEGRLERYTIHPNLSPEPRPCDLYARVR